MGSIKTEIRRLEESARWLSRALPLIPSGAQTFSKSPTSFVQGVTPNYLTKAHGARVWDVDGNEYIDYIMGLGPVILGHADPVVNEAAWRQMQDGLSFSLPHIIEVEVSELLCELIPCAEMVRFGKNGSDATSAAVRLARAYTKRDKVACCGYHGWQDWYIGVTTRNLGVPEGVRGLTLKFVYNDVDALRRVFQQNHDQISCVIMEPITFEAPHHGYLEAVKELCHDQGAVLIFDEVVTGFRFDLGGAQRYFGVIPDLACFGKAMANGFPLAAVVGRGEVMRLFEEVFFSSTHGGEAVSLAACRATIQELQRRDGIAQLWRVGGALKEGINALLREFGLEEVLACVGLAPFTGLHVHKAYVAQSALLRSLIQQEMVKRRILFRNNHMLSLAHDAEIMQKTISAYGETFTVIAEALHLGDLSSRLEGAPAQPVFREA